MLKIFILILALCSIANAQRFVAGACPAISTDNEFDVHRFNGSWILTESTPSLFDFMIRCMEHEYEPQRDGTLAINIKGISIGDLSIPPIRGDGVIHDTLKNGHYNVRYAFGVPFQGSVLSVIDTNYDDYGVIYSCTNSLFPGLFHNEFVWVLTRTGKLDTYDKQNIITKLDSLKVARSGLVGVRDKCPEVKIIKGKPREEESLTIVKSRSNLTSTDKNVVSSREEVPSANTIKLV